MPRLVWILRVAAVVVVLLLSYELGLVRWTDLFLKQPILISQVKYDPNLSDPFFETEEWSYWEGSRENPDPGMFPRGEKPSKLKHTARCVLSHSGHEQEVRFCEAKLISENKIDLLIREHNPSWSIVLKIYIRNKTFSCYYWNYYPSAWDGMPWTPKQQELILDKKAYRKGDLIKGRIDLEIPPMPITIRGVFKTTLK